MTESLEVGGAARSRLWTSQFLLMLTGAFCVFLSFGMTVPVLPLLVTERLGGGDLSVGIVVGIMALSAIVVRPWAGRRADLWGRQRLVLIGIVLGASAFAFAGVVGDVYSLSALRLVTGAAQALVLIGAVTTVMDTVPADRRGEGISYFSIAPYLGIGLGAVLGQAVYEAVDFGWAFAIAAGVSLVGLLPILGVRNVRFPPEPGAPRARRFHPAALLPGAVLALGLVGPVAFTSFITLYVRDFDLTNASWLLFTYSGAVLAARIFGGRIPDRLGPRVTGPLSAVLLAVGLGTIALTPVVWGLYLGIVPFAFGIALQYPAMLTLALSRVEERERAVAVSTFTMFFDVAQGLGGLVVGSLAALGGYRMAFGGCAVLALVGLVALWFGILNRADADADVRPAPSDHVPHVDDAVATSPETVERVMRVD